jgi:hypothetical protein
LAKLPSHCCARSGQVRDPDDALPRVPAECLAIAGGGGRRSAATIPSDDNKPLARRIAGQNWIEKHRTRADDVLRAPGRAGAKMRSPSTTRICGQPKQRIAPTMHNLYCNNRLNALIVVKRRRYRRFQRNGSWVALTAIPRFWMPGTEDDHTEHCAEKSKARF